MSEIIADWVKCCNCNFKGYVQLMQDKCPICKIKGTLAWVDDNKQEVLVNKSKITYD